MLEIKDLWNADVLSGGESGALTNRRRRSSNTNMSYASAGRDETKGNMLNQSLIEDRTRLW